MLESGWPYQVTFLDQGVDYFQFNRDGTFAILLVDTGGNENYQLFLLDTRTGAQRRLTGEPKVRHTSTVWAPDGRTIYYAVNAEDPAAFYIYSMDLSNGAVRKLVERPGINGVTDVSLDGTRLIYYNATSSLDSNLYLYDLATGESVLITPHEGEHSYSGRRLLADGRDAYIITDDTPDGMRRLAKIVLSGRRMEPFLDHGSKWEVEDFSVSEERRFFSWITNEDGYARLHLYDLERGRDLPVPQLNGIAGNPSPVDAGFLAFTYNSPTRTADVWTGTSERPPG